LLREKGFQPLDFGWTFWDNPRPISSLKTKFAALRGPPSLAGFKLGSFGHCFPILVGSSALIGLFSCGSTDMRGFWCVVGRLAVPFGWTTLEGDIDPTWSNICSWEKECVLWIKNAIASIHVMSPNGSAGTLRGFWCSYKHSPSLQRSCSRCCDSKLGPNWGQASRCWPTGFMALRGPNESSWSSIPPFDTFRRSIGFCFVRFFWGVRQCCETGTIFHHTKHVIEDLRRSKQPQNPTKKTS
jgi:hypothetical protein